MIGHLLVGFTVGACLAIAAGVILIRRVLDQIVGPAR